MKKNLLLILTISSFSIAFGQKSSNNILSNTLNSKQEATTIQRSAEGDTLFFFDGNYFLFGNDNDGGDFEYSNLDFDEQIPAASETYNTDWMFFYSTDLDDYNPGDVSQDSAFYIAATSWFSDGQGNDIQALSDNWWGMGPISIPAEGAELSWYYKSVGPWIDGYDVYITTSGMEPYLDIDPGVTPTLYQKQEYYPCNNAADTIWNRYSKSLNDWAGERVYVTFHHNSTDKEMICLDNIGIIETNNMNIHKNEFKSFIISPNPSNGLFTVKSENSDSFHLLEIINILGEIIDSRVIDDLINETFDLSQYNAGMYFIKLSNGTSESTQRVIIK